MASRWRDVALTPSRRRCLVKTPSTRFLETTRVDGVKAPQRLKTLMKRLLLDLVAEPLLPIFFPGLRDLGTAIDRGWASFASTDSLRS